MSKEKINRLNETKDGKYGEIKIIKYNGYDDIDIEFEDGYIAKNKSYKDFKKVKQKSARFLA